ncbi:MULTISPECIES: hypothetical protein [Halorussus]|uniref:hypothetical protein n=1 Tax=Halorussus TaxID=1070314 RepID=UPI00209E1FAD|nr:hypothetical protein [Halorussus vallis]USZ74484.1 hypothetical protein NGM07_13640 [Halorussus vallis]
MATQAARPSLREIGYRRAILLLGASWGAAPALSFGFDAFAGLSSTRGQFAVGVLMTLSLGVLYELDSRRLDRVGTGVPLAWSYALVAPISVVFWATFGPMLAAIPGLALFGVLTGPPASALLYVWQRGRVAAIDEAVEA